MPAEARERTVLRELAREVGELAARPDELRKTRDWIACNDLHPARPMVRLDPQNGWPELEDAWLDCVCADPDRRALERYLRLKLLRAAHLPDDVPVTAVCEVPVMIRGTGYDDYGIAIDVVRSRQPDGAYHLIRLLEDERDLGRLHPRPIVVDHAGTEHAMEVASDLIGDILAVERRGRTGWRFGLTRVLVHWRGLDQMMLDMYDNPDLLHRLMAFLRDDFLREIDLLESEGVVGLNTMADSVNGSGGLAPTVCLPGPDYEGRPFARHCVCWGESQETVGVGPELFDTFVLAYQLPLLARFGLVDYGCCEPLDHKLDLLLAKIPRLRWVSVPPWADRELTAAKLDGRYVYVYKPNPAYLCSPTAAWDKAEEDIRGALRAARGQPMHIVMKDTNTFHRDPERATRWCVLARRLAEEQA